MAIRSVHDHLPFRSYLAFWNFHHLLISKEESITAENPTATIIDFLASTPELQSDTYARCMDSTLPPHGRLEQDLAEARSLGVEATPTIFINGWRYSGFRDDAAVALAINHATTAEPPKGDIA